jgi:hypothetical protein
MNQIVALLVVWLLVGSCQKEEVTLSDGRLIGIDYRKCASPFCGGWFVEIEDDTLRFFEIPKSTDINLDSEAVFPQPVKVEWMRYENEWKDIEDLIKVNALFRDR